MAEHAPVSQGVPNVYVGNPETCRIFLSALVWMTREGAIWRALPKPYGYWNSIYQRFGRWCDAGVFEKLHEYFHGAGEVSALLIARLRYPAEPPSGDLSLFLHERLIIISENSRKYQIPIPSAVGNMR